jgi:hypothetical protein
MRRLAPGLAPEGLGPAYEAQLDTDNRRAIGAFYTPDLIAEGVARLVLAQVAGSNGRPRVCDPAVGGGAFLLAAARLLDELGLDRATIVNECLYGCDTDSAAVRVTRDALRLWASEDGHRGDPGSHLVVADGLVERPWPARFDAVIGNPPFLNQLETRTARDRHMASELRLRFGDGLAAYADSSTLFLLAAVELCGPGGRVGMILPESFLSARDAAPTRSRLAEAASLDGVWLANESVFDVPVRVCAPVLTVGRDQPPRVERWRGAAFEAIGSIGTEELDRSWSPVLADLVGPPLCELESDGVLGDLCSATAGFRDQFYGVRDFVDDCDDEHVPSLGGGYARLVTSGLIDPAVCLWGKRPTRFAGRHLIRPTVDLGALERADPRLGAWARNRLVPKVMLATQTRVLEAVVDIEGDCYPSTPTIAVHCAVGDLWRVAAVLLAPPVTAWAYRRAAGIALAREAVKLAASQVLEVPLPSDAETWMDAASMLQTLSATESPAERSTGLTEVGSLMCRAYGVSDRSLLSWWCERLPVRGP